MKKSTLVAFAAIIFFAAAPAIAQDVVVHDVHVNRALTPEDLMVKEINKSFGMYVQHVVWDSVPRDAKDGDVDVTFFKVGHWIAYADLAKEYTKRGLKPDAYAQATADVFQPTLADNYPNVIVWKDRDDAWHCASFLNVGGRGRIVQVSHNPNICGEDGGVRDFYWLAGTPVK